MQLGVRDVAQILNVSEKTVYRWIQQGHLPAYRVNEQYRFNRAELLEWATAQRVNVSASIFDEPEGNGAPVLGLADALKTGGIHYRVGGSDLPSVLQNVIDVMSLPEEVDRAFLLKVLLARESLGSTGIGNGIAIPHVRNPIVLHIPRPTITLCFLEHPIEFGALDGKPVHTLFTIISPTVRAHLNLLSRLAFALRQETFTAFIARQGSRDEILGAALLTDRGVAPPARPADGEGAG
jgi:nitrogen PTS system EIIA component